MTGLVELPPVLVITTTLLNTPGPVGVKRIIRFVESDSFTVKGLPESISKGAVMLAVPSSTAWPALLTTSDACAVTPVRSNPKFRLVGVTARLGGFTTVM